VSNEATFFDKKDDEEKVLLNQDRPYIIANFESDTGKLLSDKTVFISYEKVLEFIKEKLDNQANGQLEVNANGPKSDNDKKKAKGLFKGIRNAASGLKRRITGKNK
jgi:hypothetical protein